MTWRERKGNEKIQEFLHQAYPTIDEAISKYDQLNNEINDALNNYETYANTRFTEIETELNEKIEEALSNPWDNMLMSNTEYVSIITAIRKYIEDEERSDLSNTKVATIALAIEAYNS